MGDSLAQQIGFTKKKEDKPSGAKPKPYPDNAPARLKANYAKKYTNKDKFLGFKVIDKLKKLLD
jgi:hypothetical protein